MRKHSILSWLVTLYVTFIALWLFLRVLFFDRFWPLALLNTVAQYLFVPLPLLLIAGAWQRDRPLLLKLTIPTIAFGLLFGELFWPLFPTSVEDNQPHLTIMSFNILYQNKEYEAISGAIQTASPDLVGFQELTPASAAEIVHTLGADYPYHTLQSKKELTVGLLSRFPIETAEQFPLPPLDLALHTTVNVQGERVHVFVVHLSANQFFDYPASQFVPLVLERYGRRAAEVTRLQEEVAGLDEPTHLMCDCNLTDTSEAYARLDAFLNDSFRQVGRGFGFTFHPPIAPIPIQRIDYIWHSDDFVALEASVGQNSGSDHLPVVAKLKPVIQ